MGRMDCLFVVIIDKGLGLHGNTSVLLRIGPIGSHTGYLGNLEKS